MTQTNYSEMSLDDLKKLKSTYDEKAKLYDIKQYAMKISLNSAYGATGNQSFRYFSIENASAVTETGQIVIQTAMNTINQYLNTILKTENVEYVIYIDTDSVAGDSIINVNGKNVSIEQYFEDQSRYIKFDAFNNNYIKSVNEIDFTPSLNTTTGEIESKKIKYVMKHKVKKRMFKISYNEKEVVITEDHSLIVFRTEKYVTVKPNEILLNDCIKVHNQDFYSNEIFQCEDLGIQELEVYDIEVEDNHNFFANDILVHNSCYINLQNLIYKMFPNDQSNKQKICNFIDKFVNQHLEKEIEKAFEHFQTTLNHRQNVISFKREAIADKAVFKDKKKRYFLNVLDNEGVRYSKPELKVTGLEVINTSYPKFCRDNLKRALDIIVNGDQKQMKAFVRETRKQFKLLPIEDISISKSVSDMDKFYTDSGFVEKTPMHVKGAIVYNRLLKEHKLSYKEEIKNGTKIKYVQLKEPNYTRSNCFAFVENVPEEFDIYSLVDYESQFNKTFVEPLKSITDIIGWNINPNGLVFN